MPNKTYIGDPPPWNYGTWEYFDCPNEKYRVRPCRCPDCTPRIDHERQSVIDKLIEQAKEIQRLQDEIAELKQQLMEKRNGWYYNAY